MKMMMHGREANPVPAHSLLFSKSTKGAPMLNVPIPTDKSLSTVIYEFSIHSAEGLPRG